MTYNRNWNLTDSELISRGALHEDELVRELTERLAYYTDRSLDSAIRVAVYGSLRRGMGNDGLLSGSELLGTTGVEGFEMYSLGAFPACVPTDGEEMVQVEVYEVDMGTLESLDMLEGYPNFYDRQRVSTVFGEAFMYFMHQEPEGQPKVIGGDWVGHRAAQKTTGIIDRGVYA